MEAGRVCAKCGCYDIGTKYLTSLKYSGKGLLHHYCRGCTYRWTTPTLDAIPSPDKPGDTR